MPSRAAVIHLDRTLLCGSSDLPGSLAGRTAPPPLFGLAPRGVCPASRITPAAVRFYRTISPLPESKPRRYIFCGTFRKDPFERSPPAVSRHVALWRPDFPPACASGYPSCTCQCSVSHGRAAYQECDSLILKCRGRVSSRFGPLSWLFRLQLSSPSPVRKRLRLRGIPGMGSNMPG